MSFARDDHFTEKGQTDKTLKTYREAHATRVKLAPV
jgi:hypothetical protein